VSLLLRVQDLEVSYGAVPAVERVALEVPTGEIRAILGANGAGKSSTIKAILGLVKARGTIELEGRPIHGAPPHRIHQLGVAWVPEGRQLFSTLTVHENLKMGAFEPRLLIMDEPSLGLAPKVVQRLFEQIREINARGLSILMVEQNARQALKIAHYAYLLEVGRLAAEGPSAALMASEDVQRVYLGG